MKTYFFNIEYIDDDYANQLMQIGESVISYWVNKCSNGSWYLPYPKEDLAQEFRLHIWKNIKNYDPRKASFSTWCGTVIKNKIISMIRTCNKKNKDVMHTFVFPILEIEEDKM
jgi:RNA polymerase sigma factor (sigma-70 family)